MAMEMMKSLALGGFGTSLGQWTLRHPVHSSSLFLDGGWLWSLSPTLPGAGKGHAPVAAPAAFASPRNVLFLAHSLASAAERLQENRKPC